jgi:hypothetical protein
VYNQTQSFDRSFSNKFGDWLVIKIIMLLLLIFLFFRHIVVINFNNSQMKILTVFASAHKNSLSEINQLKINVLTYNAQSSVAQKLMEVKSIQRRNAPIFEAIMNHGISFSHTMLKLQIEVKLVKL